MLLFVDSVSQSCWFSSHHVGGRALKGVSNILSAVSTKTDHYKLYKVRFYCRPVVYWIAVDSASCMCLINWHLGVLLKYPSVLWSAADLLWLEMLWATAKKMLTCLSGRNMADSANKVCSSDSYKQQVFTIHSTATHQKHLCCSVHAAGEDWSLTRFKP